MVGELGGWMCGRVWGLWGAVGFVGAGVGVWGDGCVCVFVLSALDFVTWVYLRGFTVR